MNFSYWLKAHKIFQGSEVEEKRQLLNFLLQNLKLNGEKLVFKMKTPFDTVLQASKCSTVLPIVDAFRIVNWKKVREEIEPFRIIMEKRLLTINA